MKLLQPSLLSLMALAANAAWDCDQRCGGYQACMQENTNSRRLAKPDPSTIEDIQGKATWPVKDEMEEPADISSTNLRGSNTQRHLEDLLVFQLQMYWEEGVCWQEEWRERQYCLDCQGDICSSDEYLEIDTCSGSSQQRFIYKPVPGSGGGKLMPYTRPDLCWTRTRVNAHQLKPCGDNRYNDGQGRDVQIIIGFDADGVFELHPNGIMDRCMDNHHHPKPNELIRAGSCEEARANKTSKWMAINKSTETRNAPSPTPHLLQHTGVQITGSLPPVKARGAEYCDSHTCGLCEGDCDNDDQCEGHLRCFQRDGGEEVPGCSGGRNSPSKTDYCYDPNFAAGGTSTPDEPPPDEEPELDLKGRDYCKLSHKCGLCQGDCDDDDDCEGDLVCHQRGRFDNVPGCRGGFEDGSISDYCVNP